MTSILGRGKQLLAGKDNFDQNVVTSIQKAISKEEMPTKIKHVRSIIIASHQERGGSTFWATVLKLPLQSQGPTCWKMCHTLHKLLRDGHPSLIHDCMKYISWLEDLGKVWGHLPENFGPINAHYLKMITARLKFHKKHTKIPGNLDISDQLLAEITGHEANGYFEFGVELLDLMDDLMNLQAMVFHQLERLHDNSMTQTGQCKLYPLVLVIQDSCQLYDYLVKILFKLHKAIPADALEGHRERFFGQFKDIKHFYDQCASLQYFRGLIQVPALPDRPPNFKISSEIFQHKKPVAIVAGEEPDEEEPPPRPEPLRRSPAPPIESLVETSSVADPVPDGRDAIISQLRAENQHLRNEIEFIKTKAREKIGELNGELQHLRDELAAKDSNHESMKSELAAMRMEMSISHQENEELRESLRDAEEAAVAAAALSKAEEHARTSDDRFKKLKDLYENLKQEHIALLRSNAATKKEAAQERQGRATAEQQHKDAMEEIQRVESERSTVAEAMQKSSDDNSEQISRLNERIEQLTSQRQEYEERLMQSESEKETLKSQVTDYQSTKEQLARNLQLERDEKQQAGDSAGQRIEELQGQLGEIQSNAASLDERNQALRDEIASITAARTALENELGSKVSDLETQLAALLDDSEQKTKDLEAVNGSLQSELDSLRSDLAAQLESSSQKNAAEGQALEKALEKGIEEVNYTQEFISSDEFISHTSNAEAAVTDLRRLISDTDDLSEAINKSTGNLDLSHRVHSLTQRICRTMEGSKAACNRAPPEQSEELAEHCTKLGENSVTLFETMKDEYSKDETDTERLQEKLSAMRADLASMTVVARSLLLKEDDVNSAQIVEMVDEELEATQKAIAEGAERIQAILEKSRKRDTGVKLEVNEKILDSVTGLMAQIQQLVRKSKDLQSEIVASGRGSASVKEFYMKNHRWTEGLVSAAKAVGWGASTLVERAERIVEGKGSLNELKVCSQEIAASTAQLVVSSQVKSDKDSSKLAELKSSAKAVKTATAEVVASSNFGEQRIEDATLLDFSNMSLMQTKRAEMNCQVHLLELESKVVKERSKLTELRKRHYQLAGESEGWEVDPENGGN